MSAGFRGEPRRGRRSAVAGSCSSSSCSPRPRRRIPLFTPVTLDLISNRVGDFRRNPLYGVPFDRLWVK